MGLLKGEHEKFVEKVAKACHEVNKVYCEAHGDKSHKPWNKAPKWQKESKKAGVEFILSNPEASASASHDSWTAQKIEDGWKFGEKKDESAKTHPCLVSFRELPVQQQVKDVLFKQVVKSFL